MTHDARAPSDSPTAAIRIVPASGGRGRDLDLGDGRLDLGDELGPGQRLLGDRGAQPSTDPALVVEGVPERFQVARLQPEPLREPAGPLDLDRPGARPRRPGRASSPKAGRGPGGRLGASAVFLASDRPPFERRLRSAPRSRKTRVAWIAEAASNRANVELASRSVHRTWPLRNSRTSVDASHPSTGSRIASRSAPRRRRSTPAGRRPPGRRADPTTPGPRGCVQHPRRAGG